MNNDLINYLARNKINLQNIDLPAHVLRDLIMILSEPNYQASGATMTWLQSEWPGIYSILKKG